LPFTTPEPPDSALSGTLGYTYNLLLRSRFILELLNDCKAQGPYHMNKLSSAVVRFWRELFILECEDTRVLKPAGETPALPGIN
jgi:hypothetical protein